MIIVTGGAGFIGSNIVKALNQDGRNDILVVDNLTDGNKYQNLVDLDIIDYLDKDDFIASVNANHCFGQVDVIFHEGACSSTTEWDGKYMMKNNYQYSKDLLQYSLNHQIPFLYASSAAVYGNRNQNFIENRLYEQPLNVYAYSKFLFDEHVRTILNKAQSQVCGFRYFNVYGPRENHKGNMASIAYHLNNQINKNQKPKLFIGSETFKRDFIYVDDVAAVNLWFWKKNISGIYNCGTGRAESFQIMANAVLGFHNQNQNPDKVIDLEYIPFPDKLQGHYQSFTQADLTFLRAAGYDKSFKTVAEGVKEYLNFLQSKSKHIS